ncbi:MAG: sigma-70 family RNA polymerase sigma factor [Candidatus Wallbacteria bacterium]|nr:sigma-70 family RNA polymerase sigma factor [Candidatus Wallbacteria bacterium]
MRLAAFAVVMSIVDSDSPLLSRAREGDLTAFEELVTRHEKRVYAVARRMLRNDHDAQDVTQETFLSALDHLPRFREETRFGSWLLTIATHAALKVIRRRKGLELVPLEDAADAIGGVPTPEWIAPWSRSPVELLETRETLRHLVAALDELADKYRLVFLLRDVARMSVRDTAAALGISEANVKVRLLRARLQLRERLTRLFGDSTRRMEPHRHDEQPEPPSVLGGALVTSGTVAAPSDRDI